MAITRFREKYFFLSNMYTFEEGIVTPDGTAVHTSEQLYLSARFLDPRVRRTVQEAPNGFMAKSMIHGLTRKRAAAVREDWEEARVPVMRDCVMVKFALNQGIARQLIETGEEELVEGNNRGDTFWGVSPPPPNGRGENMLGKILMETREALVRPDFSVDADELIRRIFSGVIDPS